MFCPYCGTQLPQEARFCAQCGMQVSAPDRADVPRPRPKRKKTRILLVAAIVLAVLILIIGGSYLIGSALDGALQNGHRDYEDLIEDYFDDVFEPANTQNFTPMVFPALLMNITGSDMDDDRIAHYIDRWYSEYGNDVEDWRVVGIERYDIDEYFYLQTMMPGVEAVMNVTVAARLDGPWNHDELSINFDLVQVDGTWYILQVW